MLLVLAFAGSQFAFSNFSPSHNYTISDGLPHNGITFVFEDNKGYMWIGTYNGLCRYDGYNFEVLKNTPTKSILAGNRVRSINQDKNGIFWIGTDDGVTLHNPEQNSWEKLNLGDSLSKQTIKARHITFSPNHEDVLILTEENGVLLATGDYRFKSQLFISDGEDKIYSAFFYSSLWLNNEVCLVTSSHGLFSLNVKEATLSQILPKQITDCSSVLWVENNKLILTTSAGLSVLSCEVRNKDYSFSLEKKLLTDRHFTFASIDKFDNLWLGDFLGGISHVKDVHALINNKPYTYSYYKPQDMPLRVGSILPTQNFGCWVSTFNHGVYRFPLKSSAFRFINPETKDFSAGRENGPFQPNNKQVTLNTNAGISLFNPDNGNLQKFPKPFDATSIYLFTDRDKNIWLKKKESIHLYVFSHQSKQITKLMLTNHPDYDDYQLRQMAQDKNGDYWLACRNNVYRLRASAPDFVPELKPIQHFKGVSQKIPLARCAYSDTLLNTIWIGTDAVGLFRIKLHANPDSIQVDQYLHDKNNPSSLPSDFVTSIIRLPNKQLWVGTEGGGVCEVKNANETPVFTHYTEEDGLTNNAVKSMLFDDYNQLWISSNIGLSRMNTTSKKIIGFDKSNGLPFEDFDYHAAKTKNGKMVFRGHRGFMYFSPQELSVSEPLPKLYATRLNISSPNPLEKKDSIILLNGQNIHLKYNENVFSVDINSLHYSNPKTHLIQYKLDPIHKDWIKIKSSQQKIHFNGIAPGVYSLRIKASNALNQWTPEEVVHLTITPPIWKTTWAYLIYFVLISAIVVAIVRFLLRLQNLKHSLEIEQLEKDNVKKVNAAKLRYFSNISHEIKTPLTLISEPLNQLLSRYKNHSELGSSLQVMQRQAKRMAQLVNQVHDFQKADADVLDIHKSTFKLRAFLNELLEDFQYLAQKEGRMFTLAMATEIAVEADRDKLEKIINNLLSNAFKYTLANDQIKLACKVVGKDNLQLEVSDTGRGISKNDLPHIFERFYQSREKAASYIGGAGIGLAFTRRLVEMHNGSIEVESELGKGTTFRVALPVVTDLSDDWKEAENQILAAEKEFKHKPTKSYNTKPQVELDDSVRNATIFIVEDNADMRDFIGSTLKPYFKVALLANGKECRNRLNEEWPDLVLSDVLMPEMNGFELCEHIKSDIKTSHIPLILLTACTQIEDLIKGKKHGADAYIHKPFNPQHLLAEIESQLVLRKKLRERFEINIPLKLEKNFDVETDAVFLQKLYEILNQNLDNQDLDLDTVARELYMNRNHFYLKVKALTNHTPYEFLKSFRLKKAAQLLVEKQHSVIQVSELTGFKSRTHFSRLFKEVYKVSPGAYANSIQNNG